MSGPGTEKPGKSRFPLVQVLRAAAAFAVALLHILNDGEATAPGNPVIRWLSGVMPWTAGVDVFFVVSGFVIAHASRALFDTRTGPARFLARRLARIVPLYWSTTTLFLLSVLVLPHAVNAAIGGGAFVLASYAFIPAARPDGLVQPAYGLGWTLNYEMFFYVVFAPFLVLRRGVAVALACAVLIALVSAGQVGWLGGVPLRFWSNPIVLEFCAGMLLALLVGRVVLPWPLRLALVLGALFMLHLQLPWPQVLAWGLPAVALVAASILGPQNMGPPRMEAFLVRLGDASFALYLLHPFVMRAMELLWRRVGQPGSVLLYVAASLVLAQAVAVAVHRGLERRATQALQRRLEALVPAAG